jgi:hypothetical protein
VREGESTTVTSSEPLAVESLLTRDDWSAFQRAWEERLRGRIGRLQQLGATLGSQLSGALLIFALRERQGPFALAAFLVGACTTLGTIAWLRSLSRRFSLPDDDGLILGRVRIEARRGGASADAPARPGARFRHIRDATAILESQRQSREYL